MYDDEWALIADSSINQVTFFNLRNLTGRGILTSRHRIRSPVRLCYAERGQLLIVGHWTEQGYFSIFRLISKNKDNSETTCIINLMRRLAAMK